MTSAREAAVAPLIEVEVEDDAWARALPEVQALVVEAIVAALTHELLPHDENGITEASLGPITILLADDATVRDLNARFRGRDNATNVLSFPAAPQPGLGLAGSQPLGDLAVAFGVCAAEAAEQGKTLGDHLQHLVVHGVLHLLGRDHENDADAEAMEAIELTVLAGLGVSDPYRAARPDGVEADDV